MPTESGAELALRRAELRRAAERGHERVRAVVEARRGVQRGRVGGRARGRARGIDFPRRPARRDAAHDRPDARELLMALAVAELVAAHEAFVARARCRSGSRRVTAGRADAAAAASARAAGRVAVDDVARAAFAEARPVGLPPAGGDAPGRARVAAVVDRAAEHGPTRRAARVGPAQRRVRGARVGAGTATGSPRAPIPRPPSGTGSRAGSSCVASPLLTVVTIFSDDASHGESSSAVEHRVHLRDHRRAGGGGRRPRRRGRTAGGSR